MPLLALNSRERELPPGIADEHGDAVTSQRVTGQDRLHIEDFPELASLVGLRRAGFFPRERGIVKGEVVPAELAGVVERGGREANLLAGGRIEKVEIGAGVGCDEPAVRGALDVPARDGGLRQVRQPVRPAGGEAVELGARGGDVEEAGGLQAGVDADAAAEVAGGGLPRRADAAELKRSGNSKQQRTEARISAGSLDQSAASEAAGCSISMGAAGGGPGWSWKGGRWNRPTGDTASRWRFIFL